MKISQKTLTDLEWSRFLSHLSRRCSSDLTADLCRKLPFLEKEDARNHMFLVKEFQDCIDNDDNPPRLDIQDFEEILILVKSDQQIHSYEFLVLCHNLKLFSELFNYLKNRDSCTRNRALLINEHSKEQEKVFKNICARIDSTIDFDGSVKDTASPELAHIRKRLISLRLELLKKMEQIASQHTDLLRDQNITQRNDRFVLPVKTDAHRPMPGIVHGSSGTGATVFVEPAQVVENQNELVVAKEKEKFEELRILKELGNAIKSNYDDVNWACKAILEFDVRIAAARLCWDIDAQVPTPGQNGEMILYGARHPLLLLDEVKVIPNDIILNKAKAMLISGPNAGGKTVILKTVGLFSLMQRAGLPISADSESIVGIPEGVFSDIGDDQSLERHLSSFSAHMKNIAQIIDEAKAGSIIILDELASGTDPSQGAALAAAIVDHLNLKECTTLVTTHFDRLKQHAQCSVSYKNAAMGFNFETTKPTYKLTVGLPGQSSALSTAKEYGIDSDIIEKARQYLPKQEQQLTKVLEEIEIERQHLKEKARQLEKAQTEAKAEKSKLEQEYKIIKKREQKFIHEEQEALWDSIKKARQTVIEAQKSLSRKNDSQTVNGIRSQINKIEQKMMAQQKKEIQLPGAVAKKEDLLDGVKVYVISINKNGIVEGTIKGNTIFVKIGIAKMRVSIDDLRLLGKENKKNFTSPKRAIPVVICADPIRTSDNTFDMRGLRVDEAIDKADIFLDKCLRNQMDVVYLLTGHGTGALVSGIRKYLSVSKYVSKFRPGTKEEGGDAVTAVWLL